MIMIVGLFWLCIRSLLTLMRTPFLGCLPALPRYDNDSRALLAMY
jgi:hypothetical protein